VSADGRELDLHFQEYWVRRGARDDVKAVTYEGVAFARPSPGVLEAIGAADAIVLCPSNPVASLGPILAVPGVRDALARRRERVVGISGIVGGTPLAGMADRLMPVSGVEVTAAGAAECYRGLLAAWVVDEADRSLAARIEATGVRVGVTDSIMTDDAKAEALARFALDLLT
jgi:LPPG:FO 2-phospho-L-lactate transferase